MISFDKLPENKPNSNSVAAGRYNAKVFKTQMVKSKNNPDMEYLNVSFQVNGGGFVNENYFDSDKPFILYKLGRLLKACNIELAGDFSLKDVAKVIANKEVVIDVEINDRGYATLDYSGNKEGIYSPLEAISDQVPGEEELDPELNQAIEATVEINKEDF